MSDDIAGYQEKSLRYDGDLAPDHGQGLTANQRRRVALQELDEAKFSVSPSSPSFLSVLFGD
jgi:hypothetical protein